MAAANANMIDVSTLIDAEGEQKSLMDAVRHFRKNGVPVKKYHRDNITKMFMTVPSYLKEIRNLTSIKDKTLLDKIFSAAIKAGLMEVPRLLDEKLLLKVARWSKKGPGAMAVANAQYEIKLQKKAAGGASIEKVALAQLLELQPQELGAEVKKVRAIYEAAIAKLERKIAKCQRRMEKDLLAIEASCSPANKFAPLPKKSG